MKPKTGSSISNESKPKVETVAERMKEYRQQKKLKK